MNGRILSCFIALVGQSCVQPNDNKELLSKIDSLQKDIRSLKEASQFHQSFDSTLTNEVDTPITTTKPIETISKPTIDTTVKITKPKKEPHQPVLNPFESKDTIYKYYVDKKLSVKTTPWVNGERTILLYDRQGKQTYAMEEVRRSYSIGIDLKFHDNGAVRLAEIHNNPGASMYWFESTIIFSNNNEPVSKSDQRMPIQNLDDFGKKYFWNAVDKRWVENEPEMHPTPEH